MFCINKAIKFTLTCLILMISSISMAQKDPVTITSVLNNSSFLNHNIPAYLRNGESYSASVTMKNTGTNTWTAKDDYRLVLHSTDNMYQNDVWKVRTVTLPYNVPPSEKVTFNFQLQVPNANGVYNCRWIMAKGNEIFGEPTPSILIDVSGEQKSITSSNNAEFIEQTIPVTMSPGQKYTVSVSMKNTGTRSWLPSLSDRNEEYRIGIFNDPTDKNPYTDWGISPAILAQRVDPGQSHTFEFQVTAPASGVYTLQLMMMQGTTYFGSKSNPVTVTVDGKDYKKDMANGYNSSSFVSQNVPSVMMANNEYKVSITLTNTGMTEWTPAKYHLTMVDPKMLPLSINPWGVGYISLPQTVPSGGSVTLNFSVTAPSDPGVYPFQWSMMDESKPFGQSSPAVHITVRK